MRSMTVGTRNEQGPCSLLQLHGISPAAARVLQEAYCVGWLPRVCGVEVTPEALKDDALTRSVRAIAILLRKHGKDDR